MLGTDDITVSESLVDTIRRQAAAAPERIALRGGCQSISYGDLIAHAESVADLVSDRAASSVPVAVVQRHSLSALTSILGVLFSGRPYVVIHPSNPVERIQKCLEDSGARTLLVDNGSDVYQFDKELRVIDVEAIDVDATPKDPRVNPNGTLAPSSPAAIYYTSGSTGSPKGIVWDHAGIAGVIREQTDSFKVGPNDRFSLLSSLAFSASIPDLYSALLTGATACLLDLKECGLVELANWIDEERITVLHPPVSLLRRLTDAMPESRRFESVRLVILSGDRLLRADVEQVRRHLPRDCVISHQLALSEVGVVSRFVMNSATHLSGDVVPIGAPIRGKRVYLLDENGQQVETGERGEIVVESSVMSRGYHRRPQLNQLVFDELSDGKMRRCRTGDIGRFTEDGVLVFLGRSDEMVKVRGFRVELGEIERALDALPPVRQSAVITRSQADTDRRILAYVEMEPDQKLDHSMLRRSLSQTLPDYMIPSVITQVVSLPLTATGKIDRNALPLPASPTVTDADNVMPRSDLERVISSAWETVLGVAQPGVDVDFFDLGGDSLRAVAMLARVERHAGFELPPSLMLEAPTIKSLASAIEAYRDVQFSVTSLVEMTKVDASRRLPFYCIHGSGGNVLNFRNIARRLGDDQPFYAFQARGVDGVGIPRTSIKEMASAYLREILRVQPSGPYFLGGYSGGGLVAFEIAKQLIATGREVRLVAFFDTLCPVSSENQSRRTLLERLGALILSPQHLWRTVQIRARTLRFIVERSVVKTLLKLGAKPPNRFRRRQHEAMMRDTFKVAARGYSLETSPVPVAIFTSADAPFRGPSVGPDLGWSSYLDANPVIIRVPGNHDSMIEEPHVGVLARELRAQIDQRASLKARAN